MKKLELGETILPKLFSQYTYQSRISFSVTETSKEKIIK